MRTTLITLGLLSALGVPSHTPAQAAEVTILVNQGALSGVRDLVAGFEMASGHKVVIDFVGIPQQNEKIATDAPGDVLVNFLPTFEDLAKNSKVVAGTVVEFARAGNGVAVKAGAPKPDISTPEAFKQAMLNAKSIGHSNAGTGPYNTRMFQKLGIYDQIKDKIKIVEGRVAEAVAKGDVEIGLQQTNVIQPWPGADYVGPLPADLMEYGQVGVGLLTGSKQQDVARAFIKYMGDPANAALIRKGFMEPPVR
jgi:molybdate transport system substrate-binding protein